MGKRNKGGKKPAQEHFPGNAGKVPRGGEAAANIPQQFFAWGVEGADFGGPFGWHVTDTKLVFLEVIPKLRGFESMKWSEVDGPSGSHFIDYDDLCKEAQQRLGELGRDIEQLFSLRISGKRRIYGVREGRSFEILWWDPEHQICPTQKKHT